MATLVTLPPRASITQIAEIASASLIFPPADPFFLSGAVDTIERMFGKMKSQVPSDLDDAAPGAELGAMLAALDYDRLSPHDLVRVLRAQQRQVSHYQAASYWTMDSIVTAYEDPGSDAPRDLELAIDGAAAEIGAALHLTRRSADIETGLAIDLNRRLPSVLNALLLGRIDMRRARVLVDATLHVHVSTARQVVDSVLDDAATLTTGQLRHRVRKMCIDMNPDDAQGRYEWALDERRLVLEANDSGTANLLGLDLPPHIAAAVKRWINKQAIGLRRLGDERTLDQLRADIYLDLLRRRHTTTYKDKSPVGGGVHLTADIDTLTGKNDKSAEIAGYGPVLAGIARQIAEDQYDTQWTWAGNDPATGQPVAGGITRRRPTAGQARKVRSGHKTCVHPGCRMPAVDCDIDHRLPWAEHRMTCVGALAPMCRHHHVIRHTWGWSYQPIAGGDHMFTSPLRHHYTTSGRPP